MNKLQISLYLVVTGIFVSTVGLVLEQTFNEDNSYTNSYASRKNFALVISKEANEALYPAQRNKLNLPAVKTILSGRRSNLWIADRYGRLLAASSPDKFPCDWDLLPHPEQLGSYEEFLSHFGRFVGGVAVISEKPRFYLVAGRDANADKVNEAKVFTWLACLGAGFLFILGSVAFFMTAYLRNKSVQVRDLVWKIQQGDFSARLETTRFDDSGELIPEFNILADEIQRLNRELSLRKAMPTPPAAPKMGLKKAPEVVAPPEPPRHLQPVKAISSEPITISEEMPLKLFEAPEAENDGDTQSGVSVKSLEVAYLRSLHHDLALLEAAKLLQDQKASKVDIADIIRTELDRINGQANPDVTSPHIVLEKSVDSTRLFADEENIRRLVRNLFENASRLAKKKVFVHVEQNSAGNLEIAVREDGGGFSKATLSLLSKFMPGAGGPESQVQVRNWVQPSGEVGGTEVKIEIGISFEPSEISNVA